MNAQPGSRSIPVARWALLGAGVAVVAVSFFASQWRSSNHDWRQQVQSPDLTAEEFTQAFATAISESLSGVRVEVAGPLAVDFDSEWGEGTCHLDNAWQECLHTPDARADVLRRQLRALRETLEREQKPATVNIEQIVPVIKARSWAASVADLGGDPARYPLAADIVVAYAEDGADQLRFLSANEMEALNLPSEQLAATAVENLRSRIDNIRRIGEGPLYMLAAGGTFEASLLLMESVWDDQEKSVDGRIVVAVPSRELILFTGENSTSAIQQMRSAVNDIHTDGSYLISRKLLLRDGKRWIPFDSDP